MPTFEDVLAETVDATDENNVGETVAVTSDVTATDTQDISWGFDISNSVTATDTSAALAKFADIIAETVQSTLAEIIGWNFVITENQSVTSTQSNSLISTRVVTESMTLRDVVLLAFYAVAAESVTMTDLAAPKFEDVVAVVEKVLATGSGASQHNAVIVAAAAMVLQDLVEAGKGADVVESATLTDTIVNQFKAYCAAIEQAQITATPSMTLRLSLPVTDGVTATDATSANGVLSEVLSAGVAFEIVFNDGETTYRGWAMNMQNFGVTEYQNYPFNSMVKFQGVYLGANANGVYRLDGDTDAGEEIDARIKTGILGFRNQTRVDSAYLTLRSDGDVLLKVITAEKTENWYSLSGSENLSQKRVKLGRGLQSSLYQFELTNITGSDLELSGMEIIPVILSRKGD